MDLRHINNVLDLYSITKDLPIPRIQEIYEKVKGFKYASTLDLRSAYQQLPIAGPDQVKTTFTWRGKRFMWKQWPFGLKPATGKFQHVLEIVLEGTEYFVCIFVDDIIVFSNSLNEHVQHVKMVIEKLNQHGLRLNTEKCHFGFTRVLLFGHMLSGDTRAMDPSKASAALDWLKPTTSTQIEALDRKSVV